MSPRPASLRKRQSQQFTDLQSRVEHLQTENRSLQDARSLADQATLEASQHREAHAQTKRTAEQAISDREVQIRERDDQLRELKDNVENLQNEVDRLAQENANLTEQNQGISSTARDFTNLKSEHDTTHKRWQDALVAVAALEVQHKHMSSKMEDMVREEVEKATQQQEEEIARLHEELEASMEQVRSLQEQLLASKGGDDSFLDIKDDDYFDSACQQLCSHVQQWVLRFSKFSDRVECRISSEIKDEKILNRLDDTVLDGSDVDNLLRDRVKRRDIFMSIVMSIIWEHVFSRYLFGLNQEQRKKLKSVEKELQEIGKPFNNHHSQSLLTKNRAANSCSSMACHYTYSPI
jgi:chromosome segregation ATPase